MSKKKKGHGQHISNTPSTTSGKSKSAKTTATAQDHSRRSKSKSHQHLSHHHGLTAPASMDGSQHNQSPDPTKHHQQVAQEHEPTMTNQHQQQQQQQRSLSPMAYQSPQNLSYHQQQQIHHQHLQRIGGLQRLTADLAGLQFEDPDALLRNLPQLSRARQIQSKHIRNLTPQTAQIVQQTPPPPPPSGPRQPTIAYIPVQVVKNTQQLISPDLQQQQQPQQQQQQYKSEREEVAESQNSTVESQIGSDHTSDQVRDAQETAEDTLMLRRYKIMHLIGLGNYARVYKASFPQNNKELAIKSINLSKTTEHYRLKFLPRELSILRRISHVNICKIYEILQVSDRIFIVMQFCSRGTIADLLQRNSGPFSESVARYLFGPTVDAIVYLHSLDIAHRDIKIENILLDQDFVPKLTDFSYGCLVSESAKSSRSSKQLPAPPIQQQGIRLNETFCGTLPYLSPEMIRQFAYDSKKTDSWSLGICLYVMLNDRLPFPFNDIKAMVRKQLAKDYKFRANLETSESCRELMSQLLEPNFYRRLGSQEISRHPWLDGPRERPLAPHTNTNTNN